MNKNHLPAWRRAARIAPALLMGAAALFCAPVPAAAQSAAQITGPWHVAGQINGHDFTALCQFTPAGTGFGGTCVDNHDKKHVLTTGSVSGGKVSWSYEASYMMMNFPVNFAGTLQGNAMAGNIVAAGRDGNFTATRG